MTEVWVRYGGEVLITETSHVGSGRSTWVDCIAEEVEALHQRGVPLAGVCWYPVLGMPEWHDRQHWARMGLWDLHQMGTTLLREPCAGMIEALRRAQERFGFPDGTMRLTRTLH